MKPEIMNTTNMWIQELSLQAHRAVVPLAVLGLWAIIGAEPGLAQQSAQPAFKSATEASQALYQAAQGNNGEAIASILGGRTELIASDDEAQDRVDRELFVQKYQEMHRLGRDADGSLTLYIGAENWPFPIPLVERDGAWHFDPDTGAKEVLFRRIGENELTAIAMCHEFVAAEKQYRAKSNPDGLTSSSPMSLAAKAATGSNSGGSVLFHGYNFKVLVTRPGAFTVIAYPAAYRSSGVMTFVVRPGDIVYEKDLGADTSTLASAMSVFHKDTTWRVAGE